MTLCNVYNALNLMVGDRFKRATLGPGHYWIIPMGSPTYPMPIEILIFYDIWSADGRTETPRAIKDGLVTLADSEWVDRIGDPIGQIGDTIVWKPNGEPWGLFDRHGASERDR